MSKGSTFETDFLALIFNATPIANIADNAGTAPLTNLFISLHTADPGEGGNASTSECTFTGYARVSVARTSGGWTVSSPSGVGTVTNVADITFPACTGGSNVPTHAGISVASSGSSKLLFKAPLTPNTITVSNGVTFRIPAGSLTITED